MASFVVLVVVVTTLGLTGKFNQGGIFIPRITLILTMPHRPTPIPTPGSTIYPRYTPIPPPNPLPRPTLRPTLRPTPSPTITLSPTKILIHTPLLQLTSDDWMDGNNFGGGVSVFEYWSIIGAPCSDNKKCRANFL